MLHIVLAYKGPDRTAMGLRISRKGRQGSTKRLPLENLCRLNIASSTTARFGGPCSSPGAALRQYQASEWINENNNFV